jgi:hypothetical protein
MVWPPRNPQQIYFLGRSKKLDPAGRPARLVRTLFRAASGPQNELVTFVSWPLTRPWHTSILMILEIIRPRLPVSLVGTDQGPRTKTVLRVKKKNLAAAVFFIF